METLANNAAKTTDPLDELAKAHVISLISALGGPDHAIPNAPYILGDDALGCLKDLKLWIKMFDEKHNRLDVARVISETNLVTEDLITIINNWQEAGRPKGTHYRIVLACLELLVPLSWPLLLEGSRNTLATNRHKSHIETAQRGYRRAFLAQPKLLYSIVSIALPSVATPKRDRSSREEAIIRLALYFFRNILIIDRENPGNDSRDGRNDAIIAFSKQNIFKFVTMLSGDSEFSGLFIVLVDLLYNLVRGVDPANLFGAQPIDDVKPADAEETGVDRKRWLSLEEGYEKSKARMTRHNRFGTMTSLVVNKTDRLTISGQHGLSSSASSMDSIDALKKPRASGGRGRRKVMPDEPEKPVRLTVEAKAELRIFVEDFIDNAFNVLMVNFRKEIERESDRVGEEQKLQYLYLSSWFMSAERQRQKEHPNQTQGFGLIASVLDHRSLIIVMRLLQNAVERREMQKISYSMTCFHNILLIAAAMQTGDLISDQEIAENMVSRLFYEEAMLNILAHMPTVLKGQGVLMLQICCELTVLILKVLEDYSKNTKMYIKSKARTRKSTKRKLTMVANGHDSVLASVKVEQAKSAAGIDKGIDEQIDNDGIDDQIDDLSDKFGEHDDEEEEAVAVAHERAFDFARFQSQFMTQATVDMFRTVFLAWRELDSTQIKHIVGFFHRVFFKCEEEFLLYRIDFMDMLYKSLDPRTGIQPYKPARKEVENFMRHYMRRLERMLEQRPALYIELLFTKMGDTMFFMKHGYDDEQKKKRKRTKIMHLHKDEDQDIERLSDVEPATKPKPMSIVSPSNLATTSSSSASHRGNATEVLGAGPDVLLSDIFNDFVLPETGTGLHSRENSMLTA
ncbi:timeless protein-domain-containing protein [Limtongia smithiae]|uniref:timeless protein-domain-containing protein n=1 Tax=Limtongia smithiae TaxID=1125753 RepID=UPI0034CFAD63